MYIFTKIKYTIKRIIFRIKHGFYPEEVWDFNLHLTKYIISRLKYLRKYHTGYPVGLTNDKWEHIFNEIINGFVLILPLLEGEVIYIKNPTKEDYKKYEKVISMEDAEKALKQMNLLIEYYLDLWD